VACDSAGHTPAPLPLVNFDIILRGRLIAVTRFSLRRVLLGVMAIGLAACSSNPPPGPTVAVVTVCEAAAPETSLSQVTFIRTETLKRAEASGGSRFSAVVEKWISTTDPIARKAAAKAVVRQCDRIGGFPRS
jgi:hypothetical protein